ncbi:MAG TPA: hypothetical protein VFZ40_15230 [Pyrinomonadaceae bacterium]
MNSRRTSTRLPMVIVGVAVCICGAWMSAREGLAQHLAGLALITEDNVARNAASVDANRAVAMGNAVPEAHYARAIVLERTGSSDAIGEYERAVTLRAHDYALWLELGGARDRLGDTAGAVAAFSESTRLAPFYARPRWQLGNALFRAGRIKEALGELHLAARNDLKLALPVLALMWSGLNGNVADVERAFAPQSPAMEAALARFLVKRGKVSDAMRHFRAAGGISADEQRAMIIDLLAAKDFEAAYEVWSVNRGNKAPGTAHMDNGGFEEPIAIEERGFGWQLFQNQQGIVVALDPAERRSGMHSLRVDWSGNGDTLLPIASQIVLVEPGRRYQLRLAARGADLVMLGLPAISIVDASDPAAQSGDYRQSAIGRSQPLPKGTSAWQDFSFDFTTSPATRAVIVRIHRENCAIHPCPAFGHAWFDDFSLTELSQ